MCIRDSHTWAPQRCVHDVALYKYTFTFTFYLYLYHRLRICFFLNLTFCAMFIHICLWFLSVCSDLGLCEISVIVSTSADPIIFQKVDESKTSIKPFAPKRRNEWPSRINDSDILHWLNFCCLSDKLEFQCHRHSRVMYSLQHALPSALWDWWDCRPPSNYVNRCTRE